MSEVEPIKLVCWDLDGTLWRGTLEEDAEQELVPAESVRTVLEELDRRGILNSVVTQAAPEPARAVLAQQGLAHLFISPRFGVGSKAQAVADILTEVNILPINCAFVDDQPFHRAEVARLVPGVLVAEPAAVADLLRDRRFAPASALGSSRRIMYQLEEQRRQAYDGFAGSRLDFLKWCNMELNCREAEARDEVRVGELYSRAHRLSSRPGTPVAPEGASATYAATLSDRFGDYGLVAAASLHRAEENAGDCSTYTCTKLAISCRVQGRGVTEAFLYWLVAEVQAAGGRLVIPIDTTTDVNRPLRMTLRMCGFAPERRTVAEETLALVHPHRLSIPEWIRLRTS